MNEYEISGIETIARGVFIRQGKILLCRAKNGSSTYLPGGHIEFGETGRDALVREIKEETGRDAEIGSFLGVFENTFLQKGKKHAEINLVFKLEFACEDVLLLRDRLAAKEDWIEFVWWPLDKLGESGLLPEQFLKLSDPEVFFNA
jgi:ADP-ribose pyrophosphatase YjhB (NUDIX family)